MKKFENGMSIMQLEERFEMTSIPKDRVGTTGPYDPSPPINL